MTRINRFVQKLIIGVINLGIWLSGCQQAHPTPTTTANETSVQIIRLSGPIADRKSEISSMTWYGDSLILLPQFPHKFNNSIFSIQKSRILAYLNGVNTDAIEPVPIAFKGGGLENSLPGFEGFEAIVFYNNQVFLTVETKPNTMLGYLLKGSITPDALQIDLVGEPIPIAPQATIDNMTDESIFSFENQVYTLFEANGDNVNLDPFAHRFDLQGNSLEPIPFPTIEYRITDATQPDMEGFFWALNVFFPFEQFSLNPAPDLLTVQYGSGPSHAQDRSVERLVSFHITPQGIRLADRPPIQLVLESSMVTRNWEAVEYLDQRGFLVATDKFPQTLFGFIPYQISNEP